MSEPSAVHSSFVIERSLPAPVERVFAAWADVAFKRRWSSCHEDWRSEEHHLDFRIDGTETSRVVEPDGTAHTMRARFFDIVPDRRIVYAYEMYLDDVRISVSLVTVMLVPVRSKAKASTKMTFTEQVTFLDGHGDVDVDERREGTDVGLRTLEEIFAGDSPRL